MLVQSSLASNNFPFLINFQYETIEKVLQRGEKIDDLVAKSEGLSMGSKTFYKTVIISLNFNIINSRYGKDYEFQTRTSTRIPKLLIPYP